MAEDGILVSGGEREKMEKMRHEKAEKERQHQCQFCVTVQTGRNECRSRAFFNFTTPGTGRHLNIGIGKAFLCCDV